MKETLEKLVNGEISISECESILKADSIRKLDSVAKFDCGRKMRTGFPEAILAESKDYKDLVKIIKKYYEEDNSKRENLIITRLSQERLDLLKSDLSYLLKKNLKFHYNSHARILIIYEEEVNTINPKLGKIGILTAGTSDLFVAEEAKVIVEQGGCEVITSYDIGIAGIHRLFPQIAKMIENEVSVIIVCAGMEGALPSVVAGLVDIPVIGVPTSVGYGIGADGKAALYAMLQSCAPGLSVVNIDNGFGAGVFALTLVNTIAKKNKGND